MTLQNKTHIHSYKNADRIYNVSATLATVICQRIFYHFILTKCFTRCWLI